MSRETATFPLAQSVLSKLLYAGLDTTDGVATLQDSALLSKGTGLSESDAQEVCSWVQQDAKWSAPLNKLSLRSALDLLKEEQDLDPIVSFCQSLDNMLGGGFPLQKITELCGSPGTGKTQICLQLAVDVHIPISLGGVGGEVVYIDTEGSLIVERLAEIAKSAVSHCHHVASEQGISRSNQLDLTVEKFLAGTHVFRCHDHLDLMGTIQVLPSYLNQNDRVKLVIIDSLACPFRHNIEDALQRNRLLGGLSQNLLKMASKFKVAVVLTNQMTTKILPNVSSSPLIPALGDNWAHIATNRIILSNKHGEREAALCKGLSRDASCSFIINDDGIRDG